MRNERFHISAGALLLSALIYYLADTGELLAVLLPIAVHELGHILVLRLLGLRITGFRVELKGFCMDYCGYTTALGHTLAAAAGPAAGLLYALAASLLEKRIGSAWLALSAGVSLLLSLFNLLPALPLDGGRMLDNLACALFEPGIGRRLTTLSGLLTGMLLLAAGVYFMLNGQGIALALAAVWVLMYQNLEEGIVKKREIL